MITRIARLLVARGTVREPTAPVGDDPQPGRRARSLADEVFLVALDPESGRAPKAVKWGVRAALLLELRHEGRIEVSGSGRRVAVAVVDARALGDLALDLSLRGLDVREARRVVDGADQLPSHRTVAMTLVDDEVLVEERSKRFGVFPVRRFVLTPAARREELVARLRGVVVGASVPDERTALLIASLEPFVPFGRFMPREEVRQARRRAQEIAAGLTDDDRALVGAVKVARKVDGAGGDVAFAS